MIKRVKNKLVKLREDSHLQEIARGGAIAFVLKIAGAGLSFLLYMLIARQLGAADSGIFFLALSIITPIAVLARFGMDNSLIRFVAAHAHAHEWSQVRGVIRHALRLAIGFAVLTVAVLELASGWLSEMVFGKPELTTPLRWMVLAIVPLAAAALFASALQGLKSIRDSILLLSVLPALLSIPLVILLAPTWGVSGAAQAYLAGTVLTGGYGIWAWRRKSCAWPTAAEFPVKTLFASSLPILVATFLQQLMAVFPTFMLGIWGSNAEVGIFSAALRTAGLVSLVLIAGNSILGPKFSVLYRNGDMQTLDRVARQGALMMSLMAMPVILVFLLLPEWLMGLFGKEFVAGSTMLVIMALGQLVNVMTGSVGVLLMMTGKERELLSVSIMALLICLLLSLILIPQYGGVGAAVATSISVAAVNLLRVRTVWVTMGIMTLPILRFDKGIRK